MLKEKLFKASFTIALSAIVCAAGTAFSQDGAQTKKSGPVSTRSIRPFTRSETPANQAPDLYDAKSDEFNYFREDLGRQEISSRQKARLEQLASRVVYADPMDKPAADGSEFIDIYSPDEVYEDGEEFIGLDDPDVIYADDENNILAQFAEACSQGAAALTLLTGVGPSASNGRDGQAGPGPAAPIGPPMPMPTVTMDSGVAPGGAPGVVTTTPGGPDSKGGPAKKEAGPSKNDDSALLFPGGEVENPFKELAAAEDDFDFFKADKEFKPKSVSEAKQQAAGSGYMGGAGPTSSYDFK